MLRSDVEQNCSVDDVRRLRATGNICAARTVAVRVMTRRITNRDFPMRRIRESKGKSRGPRSVLGLAWLVAASADRDLFS